DSAAGLGLDVTRTKLLVLVVGVLLSAAATAVAGPVAFVAFLAGAIARRAGRGRAPVTTAALVGVLIMLGAQLVSASLPDNVALPVGVVTGMLGAPFLLILVVATHRRG
ncbi:MAG TPA: iron chelate uptake ABC transporter family permease subunit, partial [Microbacteriaceae bacterium]|nr:iron chelate uptake ABC transporter family permease subunit [Microbacteriaceae bacterium]